jgi:hypothetical protein
MPHGYSSKGLCKLGLDVRWTNPRKHIPMSMSVPRASEKIRPAGTTVGTNNLWPSLASVTRLTTPHLTYYIRKTTSRDHIGSLRFSALAGCHLHQTAGLSLPSRHGIRTRPRYPPGRQCFNTAIPWRLLGAFRTWCSTCERQYRRELIDKQPLCRGQSISGSWTHTTIEGRI